jgi:hypothetical protein
VDRESAFSDGEDPVGVDGVDVVAHDVRLSVRTCG